MGNVLSNKSNNNKYPEPIELVEEFAAPIFYVERKQPNSIAQATSGLNHRKQTNEKGKGNTYLADATQNATENFDNVRISNRMVPTCSAVLSKHNRSIFSIVDVAVDCKSQQTLKTNSAASVERKPLNSISVLLKHPFLEANVKGIWNTCSTDKTSNATSNRVTLSSSAALPKYNTQNSITQPTSVLKNPIEQASANGIQNTYSTEETSNATSNRISPSNLALHRKHQTSVSTVGLSVVRNRNNEQILKTKPTSVLKHSLQEASTQGILNTYSTDEISKATLNRVSLTSSAVLPKHNTSESTINLPVVRNSEQTLKTNSLEEDTFISLVLKRPLQQANAKNIRNTYSTDKTSNAPSNRESPTSSVVLPKHQTTASTVALPVVRNNEQILNTNLQPTSVLKHPLQEASAKGILNTYSTDEISKATFNRVSPTSSAVLPKHNTSESTINLPVVRNSEQTLKTNSLEEDTFISLVLKRPLQQANAKNIRNTYSTDKTSNAPSNRESPTSSVVLPKHQTTASTVALPVVRNNEQILNTNLQPTSVLKHPLQEASAKGILNTYSTDEISKATFNRVSPTSSAVLPKHNTSESTINLPVVRNSEQTLKTNSLEEDTFISLVLKRPLQQANAKNIRNTYSTDKTSNAPSNRESPTSSVVLPKHQTTASTVALPVVRNNEQILNTNLQPTSVLKHPLQEASAKGILNTYSTDEISKATFNRVSPTSSAVLPKHNTSESTINLPVVRNSEQTLKTNSLEEDTFISLVLKRPLQQANAKGIRNTHSTDETSNATSNRVSPTSSAVLPKLNTSVSTVDLAVARKSQQTCKTNLVDDIERKLSNSLAQSSSADETSNAISKRATPTSLAVLPKHNTPALKVDLPVIRKDQPPLKANAADNILCKNAKVNKKESFARRFHKRSQTDSVRKSMTNSVVECHSGLATDKIPAAIINSSEVPNSKQQTDTACKLQAEIKISRSAAKKESITKSTDVSDQITTKSTQQATNFDELVKQNLERHPAAFNHTSKTNTVKVTKTITAEYKYKRKPNFVRPSKSRIWFICDNKDLNVESSINNDEHEDSSESESFNGPFVFENSAYKSRTTTSEITLETYAPKRVVRKFYDQHFEKLDATTHYEYALIQLIKDLKTPGNINKLTEPNYLRALHLFADIEDLYGEDAIRLLNRKDQQIARYERKSSEYIIQIPNLIDSRPSISVNSRVMVSSALLENSIRIYGTITDIQAEHIVVEFKKSIDTDLRYDVNFLNNRTSLQMEQMAIELMEEKKLVPFMFPSKFGEHKVPIIGSSNTSNFVWFNKSIAQNTNQQVVIENIFHGTSYPYPYILFGPPGTGKTTTLVECVLQLWQQKNDSRILVVSQSNFACNVISKRLLEFLPITDIYRLFAKSQLITVDKIESDVVKASNLQNNTYYHPKPSELYKYRIIVSTLTASGRMVKDEFDCNFFTHLFIDECGSCTEGSALIPIAGLISTKNKMNANVILAGDPLQLGPVIQSKYAEEMGYGISMLERLMNFAFYKKDSCTGNYNSKFISKLRLNYRSNKDILHISNKLFYNSELLALGPKEVTDWAINWDGLPNRKFPIKFVACFGGSLQDDDSPSFYNTNEIKEVMAQLKQLVNKKVNGQIIRQTDIGVITPYRKQNSKIRAMCDHRKWTDIEVASIEAFQGNEKKIIILSTVRSNVKTLGFLNNEKRFNVAMTRAQGLLIIIGDPTVLIKNNCWYEIIRFCEENQAVVAEIFN